jgi:uncharacterized protein
MAGLRIHVDTVPGIRGAAIAGKPDLAQSPASIGQTYIVFSSAWYAGTTVICFLKPFLFSLVATAMAPAQSGIIFSAVLVWTIYSTLFCLSRWGLLPAFPETREKIGEIGKCFRKVGILLKGQAAIAETDDGEYFDAVQDLLDNRLVVSMSVIRHHRTSTLDHCLVVSQISYYLAKALGFDAVSAARGAILHDFFLYDWREKDHPHHPTRHPEIALGNARAIFSLNAIEEDVIRTHMWPVTREFYAYRESFLVSAIDKIATIGDIGPLLRGIATGK